MQNTVPSNSTKSKRTSEMKFSYERLVKVNIPGSINKLGELITENNINIDTPEIMRTITTYMQDLTSNQQLVFRAYYLRRMTPYEIYITYRFAGVNDVERTLVSATKKYIKLLIEYYGVK